MKNLRISALLLLAITLLFSACKKDIDEVTVTEEIPLPKQVFVNADTRIIVFDNNLQPVDQAEVQIGNELFYTNEDGWLEIRNIKLEERGSPIHIRKAGYFEQTKMSYNRLNKWTHITAILNIKELVATNTSTQDFEVNLPDDAQIRFAANSFVLGDGSPYEGTVQVYVHRISPTATTMAMESPGNLQAIDKDGKRVLLGTYGMITVELESPSGTPLNLHSDFPATINLPLPSELQANAPDKVPTWSFHTASGYWIEEGTATLNGNAYTFEASHFSTWNVDWDFENAIQISGRLVNDLDIPREGAGVWFAFDNLVTAASHTNQDGEFSLYAPSDTDLELIVVDICGIENIFSIGSFSEDTNLGDLVIPGEDGSISLSGAVKDCDNQPVTEGYLKLTLENSIRTISLSDDGTFSASIPVCAPQNIDYTAIDTENLTFSALGNFNAELGEHYDLGILVACDGFDEYLIYQIDGGDMIVNLSPNGTITTNMQNDTTFRISANFRADQSSFLIIDDLQGVGNYTASQYIILPEDIFFAYAILEQTGCYVDVNISEYNDTRIIGTYSGLIQEYERDTLTGPPIPIEGSFNVIHNE